MSLSIGNNLSSMIGLNNLNKNTSAMNSALRKLSAGLKITQASDNPAGLVISEQLRSQLSGLSRSMQNTQEANNVLSIAEGGLQELSNQLISMRELALQSLNSGVTSPSQISANQAQLNGSLNAMSNITSTTRYAGQNLLDGSKGVTFGTTDASGLINTAGSTINTYSPDAVGNTTVSFSGTAANQAEKAYVETNLGGGTTLSADQSFTVTGATGSVDITAAAGTTISDIADQINSSSDQTGVTAYAINGGTELRLASNEYGSDQTVRVNQTTGSAFAAAGTSVSDTGQDATVTIGGQTVTAAGLSADVTDGSFTGTIQLTETAAQTGYDADTLTNASAASATINDIQGGMRFQLGETAGASSRDVFGIESFSLNNVGKTTEGGTTYSLADLMSGGSAALANDPATALKVIDQAITDVAMQRASIGAYQSNTLQANANSLSVAIENTTSTESSIRDADMAAQISDLVKYQLLQKTSLMAIQSSNMTSKNVLSLLGG